MGARLPIITSMADDGMLLDLLEVVRTLPNDHRRVRPDWKEHIIFMDQRVHLRIGHNLHHATVVQLGIDLETSMENVVVGPSATVVAGRS
jgi:hypothetical protein